jgi:glycosyltransferase involved in cell wall biosynthesis
LSVILPVYNTEKFVAQAIESILNQTFVDFELIIADDGSKDGSCKIVNAYAEQDDRIIISHNEINQGKVKTVNRLFEMCRGKYLTIHDADDWSELARFQIQLDFLQKFDKNVLCGSNFYSHFGSKRFIASDLQTEGGKIIEDLGKHSQIHGPTAIFHSEIVKELGTLYRDFSTAEDIDFILRTSEKYLVTNIPQCLYHYRIHDNSITNNLNSFNYENTANPKRL